MERTEIQFIPSVVEVTGKRDSTVSGSAKIKNIGTNDFLCQSITASCGCTNITLFSAGEKLIPGEEREVTFDITLGTPSDKYVYVSGNSDVISLTIKKNII